MVDKGAMEALFEKSLSRFRIEPDAEVAIEVDPRVTTDEQLQLLRRLGFNRPSPAWLEHWRREVETRRQWGFTFSVFLASAVRALTSSFFLRSPSMSEQAH